MAMPAKSEDQAATQAEAPEKDSPLLDLSDAAVKRFIKTAKARGFVTLDALNAVLPSEEVSPDQIEDTMSMLSDMGITVVESEDAEEAATAQDAEDPGEEEEPGRAVTVASSSLPAATQTLLVHQVAYLVDKGVTALVAATVVSVVGLASIAGKISWGTLADHAGSEVAFTLASLCVVSAIGILALTSSTAPSLAYVYAVLMGVGYASSAPLPPAPKSCPNRRAVVPDDAGPRQPPRPRRRRCPDPWLQARPPGPVPL